MNDLSNIYNDDLTGIIHHTQNLVFEDGILKNFKVGHAILRGQKVIVIGNIDLWCFCLNVTSSTDGYVRQLKQTNQIFELSYHQTKELYKSPKPNTCVRLDHVHIFKDVYGFNKINFAVELYATFMRVFHLALFNPMNIQDKNDLFLLPLEIVDKFCQESKVKLNDKYRVTYEELVESIKNR